MGVTLVAGAPVPVLSTPCPEHSAAEVLPRPRAVQRVVSAAVRLPGVLGAAAPGSARDDTADRAELHGAGHLRQGAGPARVTLVTLDCTHVDITRIVSRGHAAVYSPTVLRPPTMAVRTCTGPAAWPGGRSRQDSSGRACHVRRLRPRSPEARQEPGRPHAVGSPAPCPHRRHRVDGRSNMPPASLSTVRSDRGREPRARGTLDHLHASSN